METSAGVPLVSVVITVGGIHFNRTCYLEEAITSVLRQTLPSLELIVTDDSDSEESKLICAKFEADGRLKYRSNPRPLGAPLNVAKALDAARGKYRGHSE